MNYLYEILNMLTSAYNLEDVERAKQLRPPETNIGKLFGTYAYGLEILHENSEKVRLWDDLDYAHGTILDRYGNNYGIKRAGTDDDFYRLLIKVKMLSQLSGGDVDTIINAAATLMNIEPDQLDLQEVFPAKVWIWIEEGVLDPQYRALIDLIAEMIHRIVAAGVGFGLWLKRHYNAHKDIYVNSAQFIHEKPVIDLNPAIGWGDEMNIISHDSALMVEERVNAEINAASGSFNEINRISHDSALMLEQYITSGINAPDAFFEERNPLASSAALIIREDIMTNPGISYTSRLNIPVCRSPTVILYQRIEAKTQEANI